MTGTDFAADRVEVLLFDLGGVVFEFDWARALRVWSDHSGVPVDELRSRFHQDVHYERFERGELGEDEYFSLLRHQLGIDVGIDVIDAGWNAIFGDLLPGITGLIAAVKDSRYRVAALSNTNASHAVTFGARYAPVLADLGRILASHELGHRKPEPACFAAAADHLATVPERVLFFDDLGTNVDGARAAGMQATLVCGPHHVRAALEALDVPLPNPGSR